MAWFAFNWFGRRRKKANAKTTHTWQLISIASILSQNTGKINWCVKFHGCKTTIYYSIHYDNWKHTVCNEVVWKTQCRAACQKLKVKHMHDNNGYCYWSEFGTLPQSYVGYQNTYGHSWSRPFPQTTRTCLVKKTWSPFGCGEDSLNKPLTTWGLGFYIQTRAHGQAANKCLLELLCNPPSLKLFSVAGIPQTSLRVGKLRPEVRVG